MQKRRADSLRVAGRQRFRFGARFLHVWRQEVSPAENADLDAMLIQ